MEKIITLLKTIYFPIRRLVHKISFFLSVNWFKTIYLNFKMLPFNQAKKIPIIIYGPMKFYGLKGEIIINSSIKMGMIGLGQKFEMQTIDKGIAEINIIGKLIFEGSAFIGKDFFMHVAKGATLQIGKMVRIGSDVKVICKKNITIGEWTGIGYDSQISDSNYHPMKNTITDELYKQEKSISIGEYNSIANRCSIMGGTITLDNCVIASNSLCNKNYEEYGSYVLIGGIPVKLLKENYGRDLESEKERLFKNLIKWHSYKEFL